MAPTPNTGTDGRQSGVPSPAYRGSFAPETLYLAADGVVTLASIANTDEFRWYEVCVKNDTTNAFEVINLIMDGTTIVMSDATGLFDGAEDDAGSINIYWDSGLLKVQNKLASSAPAYVSFFRKDSPVGS